MENLCGLPPARRRCGAPDSGLSDAQVEPEHTETDRAGQPKTVRFTGYRSRTHFGVRRAYTVKRSIPPSRSWRGSVNNHLDAIVAVDFFTVPTATFRALCLFVVLSLYRQWIVHFNVTDSPVATKYSVGLAPVAVTVAGA
jgi:hypothetical protein